MADISLSPVTPVTNGDLVSATNPFPVVIVGAVDLTSLTVTASTAGNRSLNQAISTEQWVSGTVAADDFLNRFKIWSDAADAGSGFLHGVQIAHYHGGSAAKGGREALAAYYYLTAPTNSANGNRNYVALNGIATALTGDGGTGLTNILSKGALFGLGAVGVAVTGAVNLYNVTGAEFNVAMQTGSSTYAKSMAQFSSRTDDAVSGSGIDAILWAYNQGAANPKWRDGILFYNANSGAFPFDTGSTVLRLAPDASGPATIGTGIDFSAVRITNYAFNTAGFQISGTGHLNVDQGTITANDPGMVITQRWNNAAVAFKAMQISITNTASAATAYPFEILVGGSTVLSVAPSGSLTSSANILAGNSNQIGWASRSRFFSDADGTIRLTNSAGTGGVALDMIARADPTAPAASHGYLYLRDNGSGKMQYVARFPSGAVQVIATEP